MCWKTAPVGVDMFIIVGMADAPLLVCPRCAEGVLELAPTGEKMSKESEVVPLQTETLF